MLTNEVSFVLLPVKETAAMMLLIADFQ